MRYLQPDPRRARTWSASVTNAPIRLVQWTTGNISCEAVKGILERPGLELVGVYAYSADKVGKDLGELCGLDRRLGVAATNDIDEILALKPDCVVYMPLHPDIDHLETLLRAGINVATTAHFMTGRAYGRGGSCADRGRRPRRWCEYVRQRREPGLRAVPGVDRDQRVPYRQLREHS